MTGYDLLKFLFKWKWTLLLGTAAVMGFVAFKVFDEPPRYQTASKILIERNRTPIQVGAEELATLGMIEVMNTEIEIVRSRAVMSAAVRELGYHERVLPSTLDSAVPAGTLAGLKVWFRDLMLRWRLVQDLPPLEYWVQQLNARVSVVAVPDSNVFTISMSGTDPEMITDVVNAVTAMYQKHRLSVYQAQGRSELYEKQMMEAWQDLVSLRSRLDEFRRANNLSAVDTMRTALTLRSDALQSQLGLLNQEAAELRLQLMDRHPTVLALNEKIRSTRQALAQVNQEMMRVEDQASVARNLETEIEGQLNTYNQAKARFDEQQAKDSASTAAANVLIVHDASVPEVYSTVRLHMIGFGGAAGLILALVIALIREYFDRRVEEPGQAEQIMGVPVVGSVGWFHMPPKGFRLDDA